MAARDPTVSELGKLSFFAPPVLGGMERKPGNAANGDDKKSSPGPKEAAQKFVKQATCCSSIVKNNLQEEAVLMHLL